MRRMLLTVALLAGCNPNVDTDGDGLTDREEAELATNPEDKDSDDDGLSDSQEVALGTDPLDQDTDGDTYLDPHELDEDTDPTDPSSRIYTGYWPYNPDKDQLEDPGWSNRDLEAGDVIWNHQAKDQFREDLELYDFAWQGKFTVIDSSAQWCGPCKDLARWLATDGETDRSNLEGRYGVVREAVDAGDLQWVTILAEDRNGEGGKPADVENWDEAFPHDKIAVMADPDKHFHTSVNTPPGYVYVYPQLILLNSEMEVLAVGGQTDILKRAKNELGL